MFLLNTLHRPPKPSLTPVYNFFTPDERVAPADEDRFLGFRRQVGQELYPERTVGYEENKTFYVSPEGKQYAEENIKGTLPRFIQITMINNSPFPSADMRSGVTIKSIADADKLNNFNLNVSPHDTSMTFVDTNMSERMLTKIDFLAKLNKPNSSLTKQEDIEALLSSMPKFDDNVTSIITDLINYNLPLGTLSVNQLGVLDRSLPEPFASAENSTINFEVDKLYLRESVESKCERDTFFSSYYEKHLNESEDPLEYPPPVDNINQLYDVTGYDATRDPGGDQTLSYEIDSVGFIVERFQDDVTILANRPDKVMYIESSVGGSFIDPEVLYGKNYMYTIRQVFRISYTRPHYQLLGQTPMKRRTDVVYISSNRSEPATAKIVDNLPPKEPDGIFYRFDYRKNEGLAITWQYPVEPKRDVKYYQIFRRTSIYEPFTCIAEINFDNSFEKTIKTETVRPDRVIHEKSAVSYYEDLDFNKESSYIYTIAAVDAHGLTSGYGVQTHARFDKAKNQLVLETISRPGAPKQYPNFFVDPVKDRTINTNNFTQDVIRTSGFSSFSVYFDPDAKNVSTGPFKLPDGSVSTPTPVGVFSVTGSIPSIEDKEGFFKMTFLDLDRQKSQNFEIQIEDFRGTIINQN